MRLFIAIELDNDTKNKILLSSNLIKDNSFGGNFLSIDNYHLTLSFLGEVNEVRIDTIKKIMDSIKIKPFTMDIKGFSYFVRDGKAITFRDIELNDNLVNLNKELNRLLLINKFNPDLKDFKAHITLSRETRLKKGIDINKIEVENIKYNVCSISLMKSERINGVLTYTCIYKRSL